MDRGKSTLLPPNPIRRGIFTQLSTEDAEVEEEAKRVAATTAVEANTAVEAEDRPQKPTMPTESSNQTTEGINQGDRTTMLGGNPVGSGEGQTVNLPCGKGY